MEDSGKMPHKSFSAETTSKSSLPPQCVEMFSEAELIFFAHEFLQNMFEYCDITRNKDIFRENNSWNSL